MLFCPSLGVFIFFVISKSSMWRSICAGMSMWQIVLAETVLLLSLRKRCNALQDATRQHAQELALESNGCLTSLSSRQGAKGHFTLEAVQLVI